MSAVLTLHVLTPLHVGVGQAVGGVDLPIARQRPSGLPYVPGTTLKGCLRARLGDDPHAAALFGSEPEHELTAGDVFFGDAGLLVMPVRDGSQTFVWLTCATLLRQADRIGLTFGPPEGAAQSMLLEGHVRLNSARKGPAGLRDRIAKITGHRPEFVDGRVFCVTDDEFRWAADFATQVDVRNRIDAETGVVRDGALWSEESLAPESVLVAPIGHRAPAGSEAMRVLSRLSVLTLGGKNTVGRGVCRLMFEEIQS